MSSSKKASNFLRTCSKRVEPFLEHAENQRLASRSRLPIGCESGERPLRRRWIARFVFPDFERNFAQKKPEFIALFYGISLS
jgi:hypothetical protein